MTDPKEYNRLLDEFREKWLEFSNLQAANELIVDESSVCRFYVWLKTGDPEDAWS